jgi:hypothetical protein
LLGVIYFSFAFAYLGEAIFAGNLYIFIEIGLLSLAIFLTGWYLLKRVKYQSIDHTEENN